MRRKPCSADPISPNSTLSTTSRRKAMLSLEMRRLEEKGEKIGISKMMMMENAGAAIARYVHDHFEPSERAESASRKVRVTVVAGTGNNGGDAFVAARHLLYWKRKFLTSVVLIGDENKVRAMEAAANWEILRKIRAIKKVTIEGVKDLGKLEEELKRSEVIISAIFGTGFKGKPRKLQELAISKINRNNNAFKLSVDVPSGLETDSGKCKYAVMSDVTISLHVPKAGMFKTLAARQKCGQIVIENIGLPF